MNVKDISMDLSTNQKVKKGVVFFLNFIAAFILFYPMFPAIPLLVMVALAISITSVIVPSIALTIAIILYSAYAFVIHVEYGIIEFFIALVFFAFDVKEKKDVWILLFLTTPILLKYQAPFLAIFLTMVVVKENWESSSFIITLQTAFLSTFLGNYPWGYSDIKIDKHFSFTINDLSGALSNQFNAMNNYNTSNLSTFILKNLLFFIIFVIATKVIITIAGRISFKEVNVKNRQLQKILGLAIGMGLTLVLSIGVCYINAKGYFIVKSLIYALLSFIPVFIASYLYGILQKFNTYSELNSKFKKYTWDNVAGYDDVKEELKEAIQPYIDKETHKKIRDMNLEIVRGILMYGPTGVGKTLFARVIAGETKMNFISVKCSDFLSKWVGESEAQLKSVFMEARQKAPCIIFFDEIEAFLIARTNLESTWEQTIVTTFLAEMDGFERLQDVLIIGATNYPNKIDPAVIRPGRFDKIIYIPHPDEEARKAIFDLYLKDKPVKEKIDLDLLVKNSERYTPADICSIVAEAYRTSKYTAISNEDLLNLLNQNKATMTYEMLDTYKEFSVKFGRRKFIDKEDEKACSTRFTWDSMAGMEGVKKEVKRYVELPLKNSKVYDLFKIKQSKGILLFGPPGCGKTLLAKILADQCKVEFFPVKCSEILRAYKGESEVNIREVFRKAKENKPAIIFFDEIDALAEKRGSSDTKIVEQMLVEMDGVDELASVFVIGATNRIDAVDEALLRPGRFDKLIFIGLPDFESRIKLMKIYLSGRKHEIDMTEAAIITEGYTGAEIEYVVNRAAIFAAEDYIKGNPRCISMKDLYNAVNSTPRGLTECDIQHYEKLSKKAR